MERQNWMRQGGMSLVENGKDIPQTEPAVC